MDLVTGSPSLASGHDSPVPRRARRSLRPWLLCATGAALLALLATIQNAIPALLPDLGAWNVPEGIALFYLTSNIIIGVSCLLIAGALFFLSTKGRNTRALRLAQITFGVFMASNGALHLTEVLTLWSMPRFIADILQYISVLSLLGVVIAIPPLVPVILHILQSAYAADRRKALLQTTNRELQTANSALKDEITERQRIEEKERTNVRRIRAIIDKLPLGAIAFDEQDTLLHVNDLFCQMFGISMPASTLIGHPSSEFAGIMKGQTREGDAYAVQLKQLTDTKQADLGKEIPLRDGRMVSQDYIPLFSNGIYSGQLFLYRDITREKRVDATKSEFMSLASHQLRTPLTTMRWSFGRLNKSLAGRMTENEERLLSEARGAASNMAHTIDTMLAISRIEAGKLNLELSDFKVGLTVNEVRTQCREEYERKGQTFTIDCPPNIPVRTDMFVFQEILKNLFTNAIKYTPDGGAIGVRVAPLQQHVQIDVTDNGYGIPQHQQEKIFSKFFRGDNVVQMDTEGTGLGLYLVFLLVKMLGATIYFESKEGRGTTFTLLLPINGPPVRTVA